MSQVFKGCRATPDKSTIFVSRHDVHVVWRLHSTITVKHIDAVIGAFLV